MYFSYISPEGSTIYTGYDQQTGIIRMKESVENLKLSYPDAMLFLSGDFNARIKDRIDFIPEDNLSYIFGETDYMNSSFDLQRNSKDSKINSFGRALIELCCLFDIHVLNGRFNDITGNFTCFSGSGASVVDYMIACTHLFKYITYFDVIERDESDHLPITCTMRFNINSIQQKP